MANPRRIIKSGPCDFQVFQQEEIEVVITTHLQTAVLSKSALYKVVWSDFEHSHQLSDWKNLSACSLFSAIGPHRGVSVCNAWSNKNI